MNVIDGVSVEHECGTEKPHLQTTLTAACLLLAFSLSQSLPCAFCTSLSLSLPSTLSISLSLFLSWYSRRKPLSNSFHPVLLHLCGLTDICRPLCIYALSVTMEAGAHEENDNKTQHSCATGDATSQVGFQCMRLSHQRAKADATGRKKETVRIKRAREGKQCVKPFDDITLGRQRTLVWKVCKLESGATGACQLW